MLSKDGSLLALSLSRIDLKSGFWYLCVRTLEGPAVFNAAISVCSSFLLATREFFLSSSRALSASRLTLVFLVFILSVISRMLAVISR